MNLSEIAIPEIAEVLIINSFVPSILIKELTPLMTKPSALKSPTDQVRKLQKMKK